MPGLLDPPQKRVTYRAGLLPYAEYDDGSAGFAAPQEWLDLKHAAGKMGHALNSAFGASYAPQDVMPTDKDAALIAGLAMTGAGGFAAAPRVGAGLARAAETVGDYGQSVGRQLAYPSESAVLRPEIGSQYDDLVGKLNNARDTINSRGAELRTMTNTAEGKVGNDTNAISPEERNYLEALRVQAARKDIAPVDSLFSNPKEAAPVGMVAAEGQAGPANALGSVRNIKPAASNSPEDMSKFFRQFSTEELQTALEKARNRQDNLFPNSPYDSATPFYEAQRMRELIERHLRQRDAGQPWAQGPTLFSNPKEAAPLGAAISERAYRGAGENEQWPPPPSGLPTSWDRGSGWSPHFWASDNPETADAYTHGDAPQMMPADVNFKNAMVVDAGGVGFPEIMRNGQMITTDHLLNEAASKGHDGLVVRNVRDGGPRSNPGGVPSTVYAAISPNTVRSALTGEQLFSNAPEAAAAGLLPTNKRKGPRGLLDQ